MFSKYKYVYEVYREKNFTKAAQKLFISQPILSVAIKNIEQALGAPLFERTGSLVTPTEIGKKYIEAAEKIMCAENDFSRNLADLCNLETGHITVGGTNYLSSYVLPKIITRFTSRFPKIEVVPIEANSTSLLKMIENEELDIVVDSFDQAVEKYQGYPLAKERILLCVPVSNPINRMLENYRILPIDLQTEAVDLDKIASVPIERFKNEKFVLLKSGNDMYNRAMTIFSAAALEPQILFNVDQLNISYALVESGMGVCFVTDTLFKYGKARNDVYLYNISEEYGSRTLYIAHKKNKYCTHAMKKFIDVAHEVICD